MSRNDQGMDRMHAMNGNKRGPPPQRPREMTHSQHEDLIKFICDCDYSFVAHNTVGSFHFKSSSQTWNRVYKEVQQQAPNSNIGYYHEPNLPLKDFEPFDLEALWGRRLHQNITQHS